MNIFGGSGPLGLPGSLFTKEDPLHLHKLLGLLCLLHFLGRFFVSPFGSWRVPFDPFGFGVAAIEVPFLLALHAALSFASLVFHLPARRIKEGTRIWPEFRLHSIVFALRALCTMLLTWIDEAYPAPTGPRYWGNVLIVFATLAAADLCTHSLPAISRSNTIRNFDTNPVSKAFFSFIQFTATVGALLGLRSYCGQFIALSVIQIFAFTLTLRRKNLLSHSAVLVFYALHLAFGSIFGNLELMALAGYSGLALVPALACIAMVLRVHVGLSKYFVWAVMTAIISMARCTTTLVPPDDLYNTWPQWGWSAVLAFVVVLLVLLEVRKYVLSLGGGVT